MERVQVDIPFNIQYHPFNPPLEYNLILNHEDLIIIDAFKLLD
jgi:hypothetical protein